MLGPDAQSDEPAQEAAKERRARDEPEREGRRELASGAEDAGDDSFLHQELSVDG